MGFRFFINARFHIIMGKIAIGFVEFGADCAARWAAHLLFLLGFTDGEFHNG